MNIQNLYKKLDLRIPSSLSLEWDNDGIMLDDDPEKEVSRIIVALDVNNKIIDSAVNFGAQLIVSHHPFIFDPFKNLNSADFRAKMAIRLIKAGVSVFSFHTRLDIIDGGVNSILAELLSVNDTQQSGYIVYGYLSEKINSFNFAKKTASLLENVRTSAVLPLEYSHKVALCGGSGKNLLGEIIKIGADTFVTGETPFDEENDYYNAGINLIQGGHFFTENIVCPYLADILRDINPDFNIKIENSNIAFGGLL